MNAQKVRFGVVGTNNITTRVMNAAKLDSRFEMVAVYSRKQETADEFAKLHNLKHTFTNLEEMAKSDLIDAIYIASPNSLHAEQSILCMTHGKHVLCEKPFASNAKEVKAMIAASEKYNVTLMEAMKTPMEPNFRKIMKEYKEIGDIRHYMATYCQYSSRYDNLKNGIIENAFRLDLSNGAVMDIGVYATYPMVVLFGKPKEIKATGVILSTGVDGHGTASFQYNDGMTATVLFSKITNSQLPLEIQGEDASIHSKKCNYFDDVKLVARDGTEKVISEKQNDTYVYEITEFIDLVLSGQRQSKILSHQNSLTTIEIVDEIRRQLGVVYPADKN